MLRLQAMPRGTVSPSLPHGSPAFSGAGTETHTRWRAVSGPGPSPPTVPRAAPEWGAPSQATSGRKDGGMCPCQEPAPGSW